MIRLLICISLATLFASSLQADEGMFPISELARLNLQNKGMQLTPGELFNSEQVSLVDGICRVNGCTGSFVSSDGLIITNHHCAFDAIQKASTSANDFLQKGFIAKERSEEIPASGYNVRITEGYSDVSAKVLSAVTDNMTFLERTKAIEKRRKQIEQTAEQENKGLRAEVAEMFAGKTYVLFLYTYLKDVRLVFAPPISIGAFGGEADNWEWPRHTGDFSFMRAYTAPDGSSADYSPNNIPFHPKRPIKVAPQGVNEEDFV
ncbi:MAG: S46 family peptidase, partial [Pirellula staleyi]